MKVDNAVLMAAGTSSRFAPLSYEKPKALLRVRGEVLVERQIRQLREAGISSIYLVTGYKAELFSYLKDKFKVQLIYNPDYLQRNNNGTLWAARRVIANSYICSVDDYFTVNPFQPELDGACYSAVYQEGPTEEWCLQTDEQGFIQDIQVGGRDAWVMLGPAFWDQTFSRRFFQILAASYEEADCRDKLWEGIYADHLDELRMKIRHFPASAIYEFDSLDELRAFDPSYLDHSGSPIMQKLARKFGVRESAIHHIQSYKNGSNEAAGFSFELGSSSYRYLYQTGELEKLPH